MLIDNGSGHTVLLWGYRPPPNSGLLHRAVCWPLLMAIDVPLLSPSVHRARDAGSEAERQLCSEAARRRRRGARIDRYRPPVALARLHLVRRLRGQKGIEHATRPSAASISGAETDRSRRLDAGELDSCVASPSPSW